MTAEHLRFVTTDCADDRVDDYRRWLAEVRQPGLAATAGVDAVHHYHATEELQLLRGARPAAQFEHGHSAFLELTVSAASTVSDPVTAPPSDLAVTTRHDETFALTWLIPDAADLGVTGLADLPHVGLQIAMGEVADESMRPVIEHWYRTIHAPDALEVDGFMAAARLVSTERPQRHLVVFFLDDEPARAVRNVRAAVPEWQRLGRSPSPGGASRSVVNGPYRMITAAHPLDPPSATVVEAQKA